MSKKNASSCCARMPLPPDTDARTICLTVGTAGHIDHGKTQLTIFLTGCNTDRLPEERARGMTIDLGFATCMLPDNRRIGIVDVPGHERFVHNMVAGATGIDVVLLVIAADDGVMPQTVEHFHIVRLLGIKSGMIAITKKDLVDDARIAEVRQEAEALVRGSFLDGAPIVPLSTKTGEGYDEFYTAFVKVVDRMAERQSSGPFRLHVERSFVMKGLGTVVSGIPASGSIKTGDNLDLLPERRSLRVKGLQVYGRKADVGRAGECVAINIPDVQHTEVKRGMLLCAPGFFEPARFYDVKLFALPSLARPLRPRTQVRMHLGTSDVPGHLVLPTTDLLGAGMETYAQVQLRQDMVAAPGDAFILRTLSPVTTIGGGYIVANDDKRLRRRHREEWTAVLEQADSAIDDLEQRILRVFAKDSQPLSPDEISKAALLNADTLAPVLERLVAAGTLVVTAKKKYASQEMAGSEEGVLLERLRALHKETPLSAGFSKKTIYSSLASDRDLLDIALEALQKKGEITLCTHGYFITSMAPALSDAQRVIADRILSLYRDTGFLSPRRDEVPQKVSAPEAATERIMSYLLQTGRLADIGEGVVLHPEALERSRAIILDHFASNATLESGDFKSMIDSTRKYAIPLLEYWDRMGLTRRNGNLRVLKKG